MCEYGYAKRRDTRDSLTDFESYFFIILLNASTLEIIFLSERLSFKGTGHSAWEETLVGVG